MLGNVYLKDNMVYLRYELNENVGERTGCIYQLGHNLLNFIWFDINNVRGAFDNIVKLYLDPEYLKKESIDVFKIKLNEWIEYIDNYCPYLHFYVQTLINVMLDFPNDYTAINRVIAIATDSENLFSTINDFIYKYKNTTPTFHKMTEAFSIVVDILFEDIVIKREKIRKEIDFITSETDDLKNLNPMQKLYLLDNKRNINYYTNTDFNARFVPNMITPKNIDIKDFLTKNNIDIVEMYAINSVDSLIKFELLKMISNSLIIKRCKYCGHYFIPSGRTDTEYCDRVNVGEAKECSVIGALKNHKAKLENNPIHIAYNKAYKRNNSRVRTKKMTKQQFFIWGETARQKRDECYANPETLPQFQSWLNSEK